MSEPLIAVEQLDKQFGARWALRRVTFQIAPGEIVALVGPNGAGKTTLLRIIGTLARPNAGRVFIGKAAALEQANAARAAIGFVGHQTFMYDDLTAWENLNFYARLYDLPERDQKIRAVAARVGIEHRLDDVTRTLSRGLQQRLTIARMLLHDPRVLLLDEPYTGLDQVAADLLDRILLEAKRAERAILFSTHDLERGLALCDRAIILKAGRVVHDLPRGEWQNLAGFMTIYARILEDKK
ncbi:MAG: heme ABC exporter ATP-binding protein CcmA [Anaerolineales bacterium]|nr:heme ABC exporter ATP-binding protein CcmA [Anaerolineales bacterium]